MKIPMLFRILHRLVLLKIIFLFQTYRSTCISESQCKRVLKYIIPVIILSCLLNLPKVGNILFHTSMILGFYLFCCAHKDLVNSWTHTNLIYSETPWRSLKNIFFLLGMQVTSPSQEKSFEKSRFKCAV